MAPCVGDEAAHRGHEERHPEDAGHVGDLLREEPAQTPDPLDLRHLLGGAHRGAVDGDDHVARGESRGLRRGGGERAHAVELDEFLDLRLPLCSDFCKIDPRQVGPK